MITIITGKKGSGKSQLVKKIVGNKKAVYLEEDSLSFRFWTSSHGIEKTTEYIIVEGATDATKLKRLFNDRLMIREPLKKQYSIKMPQIIITSQNALKVDVPHTHINCDLFYDEVHWRMKRK